MKKFTNTFGLVGLFLVSFVLFLYLTFPYEVLKETLASALSEQTGQTIQIGDMGPRIPLGIDASDVVVIPREGPGLKVDRISAKIGVLSLLLGRVSAMALVESQGGKIDAEVNFGIFDLLSSELFPKNFSLEAVNFPLADIATYGLNLVATSPGADPMLTPFLSAIGVKGKLTGGVDVDLDSTNPHQSAGELDLKLVDAALILSDGTLGFADQNFRKALFKAKVSNGEFTLDKESGLMADDLSIGLNGKIKLNKDLARSDTEIDVDIRLDGSLKTEYGFLLDAATKSVKDGRMVLQLRGPLGALRQTAI